MRNKRKIFYWTLLISWMIFIAIMSHKPANISDSYSMAIIFGIDKLGLPLNLVFGDLSNFIIRDVLIDTAGGIAAVIVKMLYNMFLKKR